MGLAPTTNSHAHEHRFLVLNDESAYEYIGDEHILIIYEQCEYYEASSATDASRDEVYIDVQYGCETSRTTTFRLVQIEIDRPYGVIADGYSEVESMFDEHTTHFVEMEQQAAQKLTEGTDGYRPLILDEFVLGDCVDQSDHTVVVEYDGVTYRLTYEFDGANII